MLQIDPDGRFFVDPWSVKLIRATPSGGCEVVLDDEQGTKFETVPETAKSMANRVYVARKKGRAWCLI